MRADWNPHIFQYSVIFLDQAVVDRHPGVIDDLVSDPERIGLGDPLKIVDRHRPVFVAAGIEFVDRDHLARFWVGQQVIVLEAPPSRCVAAEGLALVGGVETAARLHIDDAHLENITGLSAAYCDGTGADMDAKPFARPPPVDRGVHGTGAAAVHVFFILGPQEHALGARVAFDHPLIVVIGMVGQRFDRDVIAGIDLDQRLQGPAEIAPVDGLVRGGNEIMALAFLHSRLALRVGCADQMRAHRRAAARK